MSKDILNFANRDALENWSKIKEYDTGGICYLADTEEYLIYDGVNWTPLPEEASVANSGINMNLYDLNKSIISQLPALTKDELIEAKKLIDNYCDTVDSSYFMLLCKDISYYTIFKYGVSDEFSTLGIAAITCAQDLGDIISIALTEDKKAVEFWIKTPEAEVMCMYLFDCTQMIVTYGG